MTDVAKKEKKPAEHPKYSEMVKAALGALKDRTGSSRQAIEKYIKANYNVGDSFASHFKQALKRMTEKGTILHTKGKGASGSFKLNKAVKEEKPKKKAVKKPAVKKPAAKKTAVKKPAAKKPAAKSPKKAAKKTKKTAEGKPKKAKKPAAKPTTAKKPAAKKSVKKPAAKKGAKSAKKTPKSPKKK